MKPIASLHHSEFLRWFTGILSRFFQDSYGRSLPRCKRKMWRKRPAKLPGKFITLSSRHQADFFDRFRVPFSIFITLFLVHFKFPINELCWRNCTLFNDVLESEVCAPHRQLSAFSKCWKLNGITPRGLNHSKWPFALFMNNLDIFFFPFFSAFLLFNSAWLISVIL